MTFIDTLRTATTQNQSMLCVGLDVAVGRLPIVPAAAMPVS